MDEGLAKIRHERSVKDFPGVSFRDDEYMEYVFSRASICLKAILFATFAGLVLILIGFLVAVMGQDKVDDMGRRFLAIILSTLLFAAVVIAIVAIKIHRGNRLYITNQRVIQFIVNTLVSSSVNAIDLGSIEDASFHQDRILQRIFHYGTLRLATVGDETTYTFKYSDITPDQLKNISKMISAAKKNKN